MALTHNDIPEAVSTLIESVNRIELLLLSQQKSLTPQEDKKLTVLQTAHKLGHKSRTYVYDLINAGKLKSLQLDGLTFVLESEAERYLEVKIANSKRTLAQEHGCHETLINAP